MKLSVILFLIGLQVSAKNYGQETITLNVRNVTLLEVFKAIEKQSVYRFYYSNDIVSADKRVALSFKEASISEVMDKILFSSPLTWKLLDGKSVIVSERTGLNADITVSGTIKDEKGQPVVGANVAVKGTNLGVVTDRNGKFILKTDGNNTLVISNIGFQTLEVPIHNRTDITVTLIAEATSLTDVVVIGYGTQRKGNITGAVGSIKARDIQNQVTKNPLEAMAGQIAGVNVQQASGKPGANPVIRIRGTGSLSAGNTPLYVVDGMPLEDGGGFNVLNPNDIESIDVLKDAASAAIYGSRGGNGVILITTKKGKAGRSKIDLVYYTGVQEVSHTVDMMEKDDHIRFVKDGAYYTWINAGGDPATPNGSRTKNGVTAAYNYPAFLDNPSTLPNTNWQDEIYRKGNVSNYLVSGQGGSEHVSYYLSGNYYNQEGLVRGTDFKRYTARANVDARIKPFLRAGISITPSYSKENQRQTDGHFTSSEGAVIALAMLAPPIIKPRYENGLYGQGFGNPEFLNTIYAALWSPLQSLEDPKFINYGETFRVLGSTYAELEPVKNLKIRTSIGINTYNYTNNFYRPSTVSTSVAPALTPGQPNPVISNIASSHQNIQSLNYSWENTATYDKTIREDHNISLLAGYSSQKTTTETTNTAGTAGTFSNDNVTYVTGASTMTGGGGKEQWSLLSYLARITYNYQSKYLLAASIRRDGSSRFGENNKWASFPSVSAGWRISSESFMERVTAINELKLRASYGVTGNFNIGNYRSQALLARDNYNFGLGSGTQVTGFAPGNFGNQNLTWEINKQTDVGLDIAILKNRIALSLDVYHRITNDLLYSFPVPAISGFTSSFGNIGKVKNKGLEIDLKTVNTVKTVEWSTNFNISFNKSEVQQIGLKNEPITVLTQNTITQITKVGAPFGQFYGYKTNGIFVSKKDLEAHPEMRFTNAAVPGDIKFVDVNKDGQITPDDRTILGTPFPDFIYGMTNHFSWKNLDLDVQLQGVQGGDVIYLTSRHTGTLNPSTNALAATKNYWRSEADPGDGITPRIGAPQIGLWTVNHFLQDGSYLRIRNVTLGYNLPQRLVKKAFMSSVRIYVTGQNLFTFTKYEGSNPEVSSNDNGESVTSPGIDYGVYPIARTFTAGVNIGF